MIGGIPHNGRGPATVNVICGCRYDAEGRCMRCRKTRFERAKDILGRDMSMREKAAHAVLGTDKLGSGDIMDNAVAFVEASVAEERHRCYSHARGGLVRLMRDYAGPGLEEVKKAVNWIRNPGTAPNEQKTIAEKTPGAEPR